MKGNDCNQTKEKKYFFERISTGIDWDNERNIGKSQTNNNPQPYFNEKKIDFFRQKIDFFWFHFIKFSANKKKYFCTIKKYIYGEI